MSQEERRYSDYIYVDQKYRPNMTREGINETPETWLDFYPHKPYLEFLHKLFDSLETGKKSVWLAGDYGTGKSNAALVTQKLFMDDEERVNRWLENNRKPLGDVAALRKDLFKFRKEKRTLFVYDYNAQGLGPDVDFLIRLERTIVSALEENGMEIPSRGNVDVIIDRLLREGDNFLRARDSIQGELSALTSSYKKVEQIVAKLKKGDQPQLLADVQQVFRHDGIYLNVDVPSFRNWIDSIRDVNNLSSIAYVFDEFSSFIEDNKIHLKTMEEVTENPGINKFYLVPVTHRKISSYWSENSDSARRANDRFQFSNLTMPNDVAFRLAAHAMKKKPEYESEWKQKQSALFSYVSGVVNRFDGEDDEDGEVERESFYDILPIHPMAAFLLKFLSAKISSNQRSLFEYLKGNANGHEFQDFIATAGPTVKNKQFLTVDYLWKYFIERDDLGHEPKIDLIRQEYDRIRSREFSNKVDDDALLRVLKATFLFLLLGRIMPNGHKRLQPTIENVELAFQGDGAIPNVKEKIQTLAETHHCFSLSNGHIELYTTDIGGDDLEKQKEEVAGKFHDYLCPVVQNALFEKTKFDRNIFSSNRFVLKVTDVRHTTMSSMTTATKDKFSAGKNKDDASICLWFVVAKDAKEELKIQTRLNELLNHLRDFRILAFSFVNRSFCEDNVELWNNYVVSRARLNLATETTQKNSLEQSLAKIHEEWCAKLVDNKTEVVYYHYEGTDFQTETISWTNFKKILTKYVDQSLPNSVDLEADGQATVFTPQGLKSWAKSGLTFTGTGPQNQLIGRLKNAGVSQDKEWLEHNDASPFRAIYKLLQTKIQNTLGRNTQFSLRKAYIELQRAPYGLRLNGLTAFTLGFVLKNLLLDKNYRWTDNVESGELDENTLAEIVETVVKADGGEIKGEKFICRLSKEDKAFIDGTAQAFGFPKITSGKVNDARSAIQEQIPKYSHGAPLWCLPYYVEQECNSARAESIRTVLQNVCKVCGVSSKNKDVDVNSLVKDIGKAFIDDPGLAKELARYMKPEIFLRAFQIYVDKQKPELGELAQTVGDVTHAYCKKIRDNLPEAADVLWNEQDLSVLIDEVYQEYQTIDAARDLLGGQGFVEYSEVLERLKDKVRTLGLPLETLRKSFPGLTSYLNCLYPEDYQRCFASDLTESIRQNSDFIKQVFFDVQKRKAVKIVKDNFPNAKLDDDAFLQFLGEDPEAWKRSEKVFFEFISNSIEEAQKNSIVQQFRLEWLKASGYESPDEWAEQNFVPTRFAFPDYEHIDELIKAFSAPHAYATPTLEEFVAFLHGYEFPDVDDCRKRFLNTLVPARYGKFDLSYNSVAAYLQTQYGDQPNAWKDVDLEPFFNAQYKTLFAPQIVKDLQAASAEELKKKLLKLVKERQEIGIFFME